MSAAPKSANTESGKIGLALRPLQEPEKRAAGTNTGLLVEEAVGPAALAGIQAGDLLLAVNGTPVQSLAQLRALVSQSPKSLALLIQRDGTQMFVPLRIG